MRLAHAVGGLLLAAAVAVSADDSATPEAVAKGVAVQPAEEFHYRWELTKLAGIFGALFFPSSGEGTLSVAPEPDGKRVRSELLVTAEGSRQGEYWRYGAVLDPEVGRTVRAWSSYRFKGESRMKKEEIEEQGVFDIASAIYRLRHDRPQQPIRLRVWSDGKIYPVQVSPGARENWKMPNGTSVMARRFLVRGVDTVGEKPWRGSFDLWLAEDAASTPVRIEIGRSYAGVRLDLVK